MQVVMLSKALVVGAYQRKAEAIARLGTALGIELTVLVPPAWQDRRGIQRAEARHTDGYTLRVIPIRWNGNFHMHWYPTLPRELAAIRPQIVHIDEEPYNLATWLGLRAARRIGAVGTFFTWQNLYRRYPPPFRWLERANYRSAPAAIAGNQDAMTVLKRKGYRGDVIVIPQFGVDQRHFLPNDVQATTACCHIGYAGGLLPEKGIDLLLQACAQLTGAWQLSIAGEGAERATLAALASKLGIADHVQWVGRIDSEAMAAFYRDLDILVLPSRTRPNWKEQFGRVLIEAMASGVCVVGSDSGEIPNVIGDGGLIFPEEDINALYQALQGLLDRPALRQELETKGRERVLQHFTNDSIAEQTVAFYQQLLTYRVSGHLS